MKQSLRVFIVCCLSLLLFTGCSGVRHGVYDGIVAFERYRSDLDLRTVAVDGQPVSVLVGSGDKSRPVVLAVHGFGATKENWLRFARYLGADFRVVAPDLPGHGDSFKDMGRHYGLDDQVRYLAAILDELGIERCHLAGNSMGGAVCALFAATHPERTLSLALFSPGGVYRYSSPALDMIQGGENPLIPRNRAEFDRLMKLAMERSPFIPWPVTSVLAERAVADQKIKEKVFAEIHGSQKFDFEAALQSIRSPALILWGTKDRILNVKNVAVFGRLIPNARVQLLEGIGHVPMIEAPEETASICGAFFRSVVPSDLNSPKP
jgi:abhydrolase domain-containing protein 6